MKIEFNQQQKTLGLDKIELEDVFFTAYYLEGNNKNWIMTGEAIIDGENYKEFTIEFETMELPESFDAGVIISMEWEWFDFLFDV